MKKNLFIALLTVTISAQAQITIPNASFENWTTASGFNPDIPVGWKPNYFSSGATKTTIAHTGNFAMKLAVVKLFTGIVGAVASTGFLIPTINVAPISYSFWAKVHLSGSDKLSFDADVYKKTSSTTITGIPYGQNQLTPSNNTSVWTQFTYTLSTSFFQPCDTVNLSFYFSSATDTSSYVIVDDLSFTNAPVGINELRAGSLIQSVYPNPANTLAQFIYTVTEAADVKLAVYDVIGNKVADVVNMSQGAGTYKADIDVHDFATGIYYLHLNVGGQHYIQKLSVNH